MGTFIRDGATQLPASKTDVRTASIPPGAAEWAAADANQIRTALLDLRTSITGGTIQGVAGISSVMAAGFDAVGDGVTDDTAAIQACVTANAGGIVFFPPPSVAYLISDAITVPQNTTLVGMGWNSKLIRDGADTTFFILLEGCSVRDMWLAHTGTTTPTTGAAITYIKPLLFPGGVWRGGNRVEHVRISGCWNGIHVEGFPPPGDTAVWFTATACVINDIVNAGIYVINCADAHFSDFWIDGGATATGTGIHLDYWAQGVTFKGMEVISCDYGLRCTGSLAPIGYNKFTACYFDTCTTGAVLLDYCSALEFENCWAAGTTSPTGYGYSLSNCSGVNIRGGTLFALPIGIQVAANSNQFSVLGSIFMGTIGTGVDIAADSSYFKIQGCTFGCPGVGGTITNGVVIAAGTSDRYIVADNIFNGTTNPVTDGGSGINKRVADNY